MGRKPKNCHLERRSVRAQGCARNAPSGGQSRLRRCIRSPPSRHRGASIRTRGRSRSAHPKRQRGRCRGSKGRSPSPAPLYPQGVGWLDALSLRQASLGAPPLPASDKPGVGVSEPRWGPGVDAAVAPPLERFEEPVQLASSALRSQRSHDRPRRVLRRFIRPKPDPPNRSRTRKQGTQGRTQPSRE